MIDVVVISRKNEAQDICSYELVSVDDSALPGFSAGAHVDVHLPGGIGITPILCMAERLAHSGADFELHYCARSSTRAAFVERLRNSPFADRVFLHFNEQAETALNAARVLADPQHNTHLYVCGPGGFMQHILGSARARAGRKRRCTASTSPQPPWTAATTPAFQSGWAAAARSSRFRPTKPWSRYCKAMASTSPCLANRASAEPA